MYQEIEPVDASFFRDEKREEAVAAGLDLVNAFRRLGVDLSDIQIRNECITCDESYSMDLGRVRVEEAREMVQTINHKIDVLLAIQRHWTARNAQAAEIDDQ
ncbi:hypothetical protein O1L44_15335 [Streptomyces noursei]|uniref:hypothetical protein n=1 Tax=Streptomyces noursei TaxID=1971 RepID=UPI0013520AAE|nr:hypothetical protein [Streptomyces noursei]